MRPVQKILMLGALAGSGLFPLSASPFATQVIRAQGPFGSAVYGDTNAVLGAPATRFAELPFFGAATNESVKLVEPAYNVTANTNGLLTANLLLTLNGGSQIIVRFDQPVYDRPTNPYGIDFIVFGNTFYLSDTAANNATDMNTCWLTGVANDEPLLVSVSLGYTGRPGENAADPDTWPWYRYDNGPYGDTSFPTQAYQWNRATASWSDTLMDFAKPVNPALQTLIGAGGWSAADVIDLYTGSGGGTGFDLHASGFAWIQYVKIEGIAPNFTGGEIDALASVRPMMVGDALSLAPENILSNTATLYFQNPENPDQNVITLTYTALDGVAQVSTAPLTNQLAYAPLPGTLLTAVQLHCAPLGQPAAVNFTAAVTLATGSYNGHGDDLVCLQAEGTNWISQPFVFLPATRQIRHSGITNLTAMVVAQIHAPILQLTLAGAVWQVHFTPQPGLVHTLECSTNLMDWTAMQTFTASNAQPVSILDDSPSGDRAFYRMKVSRP